MPDAQESRDVVPSGDAAHHRKVMREIQEPFEKSRAEPWPHVVDFLDRLPREGWLLDLAAGHGRHAMAAQAMGHPAVAVDVAHGLMRSGRAQARARPAHPAPMECVEADALCLPFAAQRFAKAVFIAGLHCIRGRENRAVALGELARVLTPGAPVLVTVWWRDPKRFRGPLRRTRQAIDEKDPQGPKESVGRPVLEAGDVNLGWSHGVTHRVDRFFHLYEEDELDRDLREAGFQGIDVRRVRQGSTWNLLATCRNGRTD